MTLSWQIHGTFLVLSPLAMFGFAMKVTWKCRESDMGKVPWKRHESARPTWNLHVRFIADSCRFLSNLLGQIHGSFMALSHPSLTWVQSAKVHWKKGSSKWVLLVDLDFFVISVSLFYFLQYVRFMQVSWHFHGTFYILIFVFFHERKIQINNWIHLKNDDLAWMSDSSQIHREFMALSCHFHVSFTAMSDSSRIHVTFMSLSTKQSSKQFHGSFMALSLQLINDNLELWKKVPWKSHESDMIVTWIWFTWAWQFWSGRKCHESPMNLPWKWHEMFGAMFFGVAVKVPWKCHESAMKVPWKWHESDMNMTWISYSGFRQFFMADSWHFPLKTPKLFKSTISFSSQIHVAFMPLSWRFHGSPKNLARNTFIPFSWRFLWKLVQNSHISYLCLSVCPSSVCFLLLIFSLLVFQVDQSFFVFDQSFLFFLWSKYRVIRNT